MPRFEVRLSKPAESSPISIVTSVAARDAAEAVQAARRCQPGYATAEICRVDGEGLQGPTPQIRAGDPRKPR